MNSQSTDNQSSDGSSSISLFDDVFSVMDKLEKLCCEPGRSPQMQTLRTTLEAVRTGLGNGTFGASIDGVLDHVENAGSQLGRLQVTCCTPKRNVLYTKILENLNTVQVAINQERGTGH